MRRPIASIVVALALASCRGCEATPSPRGTSTSANTTANASADDAAPPSSSPIVTHPFEPFRARATVPGLAWARFDRDDASASGIGVADMERGVPATADTAFEAASIAKTIIATCVMQLVEEHAVSLDADVSKYVGFRVGNGTITLRHLLTHTSTIVDLPASAAQGLQPLGDFLGGYLLDAGSAGVFLDASPGTSPVYSNVGASLAALAVEKVTGKAFVERARERVFVPLGMAHTALGRRTLPSDTPLAAPYKARGTSFVRLVEVLHTLYPVVDLFSTSRDLARFGRAILRGGELDGARILSDRSVDTMLRAQLADAAPDQALGWQLRTMGKHHVVGHEGEDAGASTGFYLDTKARVGALVLANGDAFQSGEPDRATAIAELLERLLDAQTDL